MMHAGGVWTVRARGSNSFPARTTILGISSGRCRSGKREDLNADILEGHLSTRICHVGNISYRLGKKAPPAEIRRQIGDLPVFQEMFDRYLAHLKAHDVDPGESILGPWLECDQEHESFKDNEKANLLVKGFYRQPFTVPEVKLTTAEDRCGCLLPRASSPGVRLRDSCAVNSVDDPKRFAEIRTVFENDNPEIRFTLVTSMGRAFCARAGRHEGLLGLSRPGRSLPAQGLPHQGGRRQTAACGLQARPGSTPKFADILRLLKNGLASVSAGAMVPVPRDRQPLEGRRIRRRFRRRPLDAPAHPAALVERRTSRRRHWTPCSTSTASKAILPSRPILTSRSWQATR